MNRNSLPLPRALPMLLGVTLLGAYVAPTDAADLRVVARTGPGPWQFPSPTAGAPPIEQRLSAFDNFSMNNLGQVAFSARDIGTSAVWSEPFGFSALAVSGRAAPGLPPSTTYSSGAFSNAFTVPPTPLPLLRLDDQSRLTYGGMADWPVLANLTGAASFWTHDAGATSLIAGEGTAAPLDYAGLYFRQLGALASNLTAGNAFVVSSATGGEYFAVEAQLAYATGSPINGPASLWVMGPSGPRLVQSLQGLARDNTRDIAVNRLGEAAFETYSGVTGSVIMREQSGVISPVVQGFELKSFSDLKFNDAGAVGFVSPISGDPFSDHGVFLVDAAGQRHTVVRENDVVPDVPEVTPGFPGAKFIDSNVAAAPFRLHALGAAGEAVFQATISGAGVFYPTQQTLSIDRAGELTRLLSAGDVLPGMVAGQRLNELGLFVNRVMMNDVGTIVVQAAFNEGAGVGAGSGIWALPTGAEEFVPIAMTGQQLAMPSGPDRTITQLFLGEVNARGQISLKATFPQDIHGAGGEGVIVSSDVATLSDFNGDGEVDGDDLAAWTGGLGGDGPASLATGDGNGDGIVDGHDFLRWQRELNAPSETPTTAGAVPEPSTVLLALGAVAGWRLRRRTV